MSDSIPSHSDDAGERDVGVRGQGAMAAMVVAEPDATPNHLPRAAPTPGQQLSRRDRLRSILLAPAIFLRYLLRKVLWVFVRIVRLAWAHPVVTLLLIVLAGLGYQGYDEYLSEEPPPPPAEQFDIATAIPPATVAKEYLSAQKEFDGERIWGLLSEQAKTNLIGQGVTIETFDQQFKDLRANGITFGDSTYVGGVEDSNGANFYFYVTELEFVSGQQLSIYQVLYVDPDSGKIMRFDSPLQQQ